MRIVITRLIAFVLDWLVLFATLVAPQGIIAYLWPGWPLNHVKNGFAVWGWVILTVSLPSWVYFTRSDASASGATIGKHITGIAAKTDRGTTLPQSRALLRTAVKLLPWELTHVMIFVPSPIGDKLTPFKIGMIALVDTLLLIWIAAPFLDRKRRAVHDRVAASRVERVTAG